jgi:hypothetical protein
MEETYDSINGAFHCIGDSVYCSRQRITHGTHHATEGIANIID